MSSSTEHLGYKMCRDRRLVTLKITGETNEDRPGVVDRQHAKFRTSSAIVVFIERVDAEGEFAADPSCCDISFATATSLYDKSFVYYFGKEITDTKFHNTPPDEVCGRGIHYFLTREAAFHYSHSLYYYTGVAFEWRDDGTLESKHELVNGIHCGVCEFWDDEGYLTLVLTQDANGNLQSRRTYIKGRECSLHESICSM